MSPTQQLMRGSRSWIERGCSTHSTSRHSGLHLQSLSTPALPLSSVSMCPCAYESVFYLHYPCLLLATETKYLKAEKTSLPTGLLLFTLPPAQERSWWKILPDTINQSLCPLLPRPREGGMAHSKLVIAGIPLVFPGPCTDELRNKSLRF